MLSGPVRNLALIWLRPLLAEIRQNSRREPGNHQAVWPSLIELAEECKVRIAIENRPMPRSGAVAGWSKSHDDAGNLAEGI